MPQLDALMCCHALMAASYHAIRLRQSTTTIARNQVTATGAA